MTIELMDWTWLFCSYGICFYFMNKATWAHGVSDFTDRLLSCSFCIGFHCGWISWILFRLGNEGAFHLTLSEVVLAISTGFKSAAFCYVVDSIAQLAESWIRAGEEEDDEHSESEEDSFEAEIRGS